MRDFLFSLADQHFVRSSFGRSALLPDRCLNIGYGFFGHFCEGFSCCREIFVFESKALVYLAILRNQISALTCVWSYHALLGVVE